MYAELAKKFGSIFLENIQASDRWRLFLRLLGAQIEPSCATENGEKCFSSISHAYIIDYMTYCIELGIY